MEKNQGDTLKIEGAKLVGSTWHYYKRVPKRLVEAYDLSSFPNYKNGFVRGSMKTKDPEAAKRLARAMLVKLDELEAKMSSVSARVMTYGDLQPKQQSQLDGEIAAKVEELPVDQKQLIQKSGGVWGAGFAMRKHEAGAAFLNAGQGAEYDIKDEIGEEYDPDERELEEAQEAGRIALHEKKGKALRDALTAAEVIEPTADAVDGLRGLLDKFCEAKGYIHTDKIKNKTRGQYEYAVRRFVEYHGDVPLAELTKKHLTSFAADFTKLPVSSRKDVRPLAFRDAVRVADREGLPRASARTRDQNLTLLKSLMAYAVNEGDRDDDAKWGGYSVVEKRGKVSAKQSVKRYVFSRDDIKWVVDHTQKSRDPNTVDFWGPLFGAFHGLRLEEVSQIRVNDLTTQDGFLCVAVTDEAELQKVKNENTFRTIPVHLGLVDRGFEDFVSRRRKAGGDMLFMEAERWGGNLHEVAHDGQGRFGTYYGARFIGDLGKLGITGYKAGFHSFRHAWADLARNAGIGPEQRRALAGRDSDSEGEGYRVDPTEDGYGHGFSIEVLAESLNKLRPLD
ncbi:DUF6538 domain-containing protein [Ruegeria arenilitoris]|uniref:DUF6538 domain-containing protein n=1 Tax=Ruegeria arenilitoris TaxID=1173585 RepID=UPI00147BF67F|nr:DUF6538 domain-containing protein [Ruegeria arenilitoris]